MKNSVLSLFIYIFTSPTPYALLFDFRELNNKFEVVEHFLSKN